MRKIIKITAIFSVLMMLFAFVSPEKKLNKLISKLWKDREVTLVHVQLPDHLKEKILQLNEVRSNGKLLGFACYTTAFGCRIGGCAAPTNPNVQSYETFDYMVVYDTNLSILKVDIANYGGQYGYEICRSKWLAQFDGRTDGFVLDQNVDGISGATVSAKYLIDDLNTVGETLKELHSSEFFSSSL